MTTDKECDRCGKLYKYYAGITEFKNLEKSNGIIFIDHDLSGRFLASKLYDLCPDCMRKLEYFFH